ncbi:MAG: hypothetical protein P9L89_09000 [Candidatus Celaenobacter polaris]|nr:hypothetical protein [Candidatus Celaenobacter polaris]
MKTFEILASGVFPKDKLKIVHTKRTLSYDEKTTALIEKHWNDEIQEAHKKNKLLFNGPIYRLENYEIKNDLLIIYVSATNFKELMGTNFYRPELAKEYGKSYLSNAIALCTFLETSDEYFVFVKRSTKVYFGEGLWHLIAGQFSIEGNKTRTLSVFEVLYKELFEEGSLAKDDIEKSVCLGLIRDTIHFKPELVFYTKTKLLAKEVEEKIKAAHDGFEHEEVALIKKSELDAFMNSEKNTSIAQGNYELYKTELFKNG